jgi:acyl-CoA synthetase (AMP-forming)/AMP-acid ligase II
MINSSERMTNHKVAYQTPAASGVRFSSTAVGHMQSSIDDTQLAHCGDSRIHRGIITGDMIFRSPSPAVEIPDLSWSDYFLQRIQNFHDQPALIEGATGKVISFEQLRDQIHSIAQSLRDKGYGKGDVFAIYAPNSLEYVITFQGIMLLGGVVTTANPLYTADELLHQLKHSKASCLFTAPALLEKVEGALDQSGVRDVFVFGKEAGADSFDQLLQEQTVDNFTAPNIDPAKDVAVLPYSSGTTGLPKGVMLSHRNLVAHNVQLEAQKDASSPGPDDRLIAILPFFHIFGMTTNMNLGLSNGATLVIMREFEPTLFLELIQKYKVTRAYLVPPIILFLANHPLVNNYDISSLNYVLSGAAPLGQNQLQAVSERIGCPVYQGYGLTETCPVVHRMADLSTVKHSSVGVLVPNTEAMICDTENGDPLAANEAGELLIRGPQVMLGYLDNPEATANAIDAEGWLHTGDIAYADEEGHFYIVDRLKELIKYKGYQVAPAELEALLLTHPAVTDAAVVPKADEEAGEIPKAFIVRKEDIAADTLIEWVANQVAPYKKIREVAFVDQIPKSPAGKILRRVLRDA